MCLCVCVCVCVWEENENVSDKYVEKMNVKIYSLVWSIIYCIYFADTRFDWNFAILDIKIRIKY